MVKREGSKLFGFNGAARKVIGTIFVPLRIGQWASNLSFKVLEQGT